MNIAHKSVVSEIHTYRVLKIQKKIIIFSITVHFIFVLGYPNANLYLSLYYASNNVDINYYVESYTYSNGTKEVNKAKK